ncbi:MAG: DegQ family serine endoprotease [Thiotrichales bacterium]|jgi:serine protease Do|nr:DegQ family serine endoprotease [Thiotrichales bacterium]
MTFIRKMLGLVLLVSSLTFMSNVALADLPDFTQLVEKNAPAVVNISTTQKVEQRRGGDFNGIPDDLLRRFFGDDFPVPRSDARPEGKGKSDNTKKEMQSLGTGFIISNDGYIVTNHHVIADADEITVRFSDRKELSAKVIGSDERTDVALLKVEAKGLPTVTLGQTSKLKVGEWVLAIGSPFGFEATVTQGIVSAKDRTLPDDTYVPFIQTDVAINPGNSGGPLFNLTGEVVGINSQIYSRSGGFMGLSFSIPIEVAMNTVEQIKRNGRVVRGYLGVNVQEVTSELSESFGMTKPTGALVADVFPDTPAAKAGIKAGDIILSVNGHEIQKSGNLPPVIGMTPVGQPVDIKLLRQGKLQSMSVVVEALPEDKKVAAGSGKRAAKEATVGKMVLGASLVPLEEPAKQKLGIDFGLRVVRVDDGALAQAGVRDGDILLEINYARLNTVADVQSLISKLPQGQKIPMRVVRGNRALFLPLVIE